MSSRSSIERRGAVGLALAASLVAVVLLSAADKDENQVPPPRSRPAYETDQFHVTAEVNRLGHDGFPARREPAGHRFLETGDSFPYAWGADVERRRPTRPEKKLRLAGLPVEIGDLGKLGAGRVENAQVASGATSALRLDLVSIGASEEYDLDEIDGRIGGSAPGSYESTPDVLDRAKTNLVRHLNVRQGVTSTWPEWLFWCCVSLLLYTYFGYPALIGFVAYFRNRPPIRRQACPHVSIVVVAHNEGDRLEYRISNLLTLDYPKERLEILVASDGSTDDTVARVRRYASNQLRVIEFDRRRGKAAVLNEVIPKARADIVVLADARQRFAPGVLRSLLPCFADPEVGAVSGELILESDRSVSGVGEGIGFYWRYEKFIRVTESRMDSTVGATGAIYAIRKSLFEPIPEDTILDDVLIPMQIARRGYRVLFEREALAYDRAPSTSVELSRKLRTIGGNFQLFARHPWLLNPLQNRLWFQTWSHKVFRLLGPFALLGAFGANLLLLDEVVYRWSVGLQAAFYAAALCGFPGRNSARTSTLLSVPYTFCVLNWATALALVRFASGQQRVTWEQSSDHPATPADSILRSSSGCR